MIKQNLFGCAVLASAITCQIPTPATPSPSTDPAPFERAGGATATVAGARPAFDWRSDGVLSHIGQDGRLWAVGADWKASFGSDGFTFFPRLPGAKRHFPLRLAITALRAGGIAVPFAERVTPARSGDQVRFDRGAVREIYDLRPHHVEQTFVVDTAISGDIDLDLTVASELVEDAARPGLQFGCTAGAVHYGDAFVVAGGQRLAIPARFEHGMIRLHVPAALRADGPLVIDPVLSSQAAANPGVLSLADVAYDAATGRYLVVWESEFSEFDHDVFSVLFDASGNVVPGSAAPIDASTTFWTTPRVANRALSQAFLIAASVTDPTNNGRQMIYACRRDAGGSTTVHPAVLVSSPQLAGGNYLPSVGGDHDTDSNDHDWLVVWANSLGSTQAGIQGRLVAGDGQPRGALAADVIAGGSGHRHWNPRVSRSNGAGVVTSPRWFVVCDRSINGGSGDVLGRFVDPAGGFSGIVTIDASLADDRRPCVSSVADLGNGDPSFLVAWERPTGARAALITDLGGNVLTLPVDLSAQFGLGRFAPRVASDGARFLVASSAVDPFLPSAGQTRVATLAWNGIGLVLQEGPTTLPGAVSETEITALRDGGGPVGGYAIAHTQQVGAFTQPVLTRYAGVTAGAMTQTVPTACGGLTFVVEGTSALGGALQFVLGNFGQDLPGIAIGSPAAAPIGLCPTCAIGIALDQPFEVLLGTSSAWLALPPIATFVGQSFALQGLTLGSGACLSTFRFSDTIVFTLR